ncbi:MAG: hypothetical protein ABSG71_03695 [Thermodesulfobacteriota bacterium]|jgi:ABC-type maltose transport system permease subunit
MVKWKFLLMVALYIILGVIAFFNFGFHHLMVERFGGKSTMNEMTIKKLEESISNTQTEVPQELHDSLLDQEVNH